MPKSKTRASKVRAKMLRSRKLKSKRHERASGGKYEGFYNSLGQFVITDTGGDQLTTNGAIIGRFDGIRLIEVDAYGRKSDAC